MGILSGKRGLVFGVANDRSYAWYITKSILAQGGECGFAHLPGEKMERRVRLALKDLELEGCPWVWPCDVSKDEDMDAVFEKAGAAMGKIDFIVHSVAFADRQYLAFGKFHTTSRVAWTQALDISAYSLLSMSQRAVKWMPEGGSIVAMSYYGGEKVVPGYNLMGVAKAALECTARYLAGELGEKKIRVNTISGGPLRTLAASAVGGIDAMFEHQAKKAPMKRNIEGEEVGQTAAFLLSDLSSAITGENVHVDCGFSIVGL